MAAFLTSCGKVESVLGGSAIAEKVLLPKSVDYDGFPVGKGTRGKASAVEARSMPPRTIVVRPSEPEKGMLTEVEEERVPWDDCGHLIVNGAGAVGKKKIRDGKEVGTQRVMSNLTAIDDVLHQLPGDHDSLPCVAQPSLLLLAEEKPAVSNQGQGVPNLQQPLQTE